MKKRRSFTPEFKTQVGLELLREQKELNQIASEHEIAPNVLRNWKKELVTKKDPKLSVSRQCKLLELNGSSVYYQEQAPTVCEIKIKHFIDRIRTIQHEELGEYQHIL